MSKIDDTNTHGRFDFGRRLRAAREAAGMTRNRAAGKLGMFPNNWSKMETRGHWARWSTLYRIVAELGFGLEYFFPEDSIRAAARRIGPRKD